MSATSSRRPRADAVAAPLPHARSLEPPLRMLARARRVAPLLYFELTGTTGRATSSAAVRAVTRTLHAARGSLLRREDVVVVGPAQRWFAALLVARAVGAAERGAVSDADIGIVAERLRAAIVRGTRVGVRAGWTVIEPRDEDRPLAELRHAIRGAAVVSRVEEQRAVMLAAITHELRTPLTSILGYAESLNGPGWTDVRRRRRALSVVAQEARRLARLVEGLIDTGAWHAGLLKLRRRETSLGDVVQRAMESLAAAAQQRGVQLRIQGDACADADPERVAQVVVNLIDNAIRHARSVVRVAIARGGRHCTISVADDGPGLDRHARAALGQPFCAGAGGRTGLGLMICKMLVDAHGGTLTIGAAPGGGVRATVRIPG